jgi:ferritin
MFRELFEASDFKQYKKVTKNVADISSLEDYAPKIKDKKQFLKDLAKDQQWELDLSKSDKDEKKILLVKDAIGL